MTLKPDADPKPASIDRNATEICDACSKNVPMLRSNSKGASSRSCTGDYWPAWDTIKPSGPLPISFAD
jgi:hypothetical protein